MSMSLIGACAASVVRTSAAPHTLTSIRLARIHFSGIQIDRRSDRRIIRAARTHDQNGDELAKRHVRTWR